MHESLPSTRRRRPMMSHPMIAEQQFMLIGVDEPKGRVVVHLRGEFPSPGEISREIATLYEMAKTYKSVIVYINSPGGDVSSMSEILNALSLYNCVITVGAGMVASAGFFTWCFGDIRVVQDYTGFMAHRESYVFEGKTPQHADYAMFSEGLFSNMISELCDDVLTPEEQQRIRTTEVFLTWQELLDRETCISWEQFSNSDAAIPNVKSYLEIRGVNYEMETPDILAQLNDDGDKVARFLFEQIWYDVPNKVAFPVVDVEEETV